MDTDTERFERIPLTEWRRLHDALERVCRGGVDESEDRLTCRFGGASFTVDRAGTVEAGMPLHGFEASGVEAIGVDPESSELLVETADTRYVFRRP